MCVCVCVIVLVFFFPLSVSNLSCRRLAELNCLIEFGSPSRASGSAFGRGVSPRRVTGKWKGLFLALNQSSQQHGAGEQQGRNKFREKADWSAGGWELNCSVKESGLVCTQAQPVPAGDLAAQDLSGGGQGLEGCCKQSSP